MVLNTTFMKTKPKTVSIAEMINESRVSNVYFLLFVMNLVVNTIIKRSDMNISDVVIF